MIPNLSLLLAVSFSIRQEVMTSPDTFTVQDHHFTTRTQTQTHFLHLSQDDSFILVLPFYSEVALYTSLNKKKKKWDGFSAEHSPSYTASFIDWTIHSVFTEHMPVTVLGAGLQSRRWQSLSSNSAKHTVSKLKAVDYKLLYYGLLINILICFVNHGYLLL